MRRNILPIIALTPFWRTVGSVAILLALSANASVAQSLTFAELAGRKIDGKIVVSQTTRVEHKEYSHRAIYNIVVHAGVDNQVRYSQTNTRLQAGHAAKSRTWTASAKLGEPHPFRDGHAIWVFENNTLVRLRTMDQGGVKVIFRFSRNTDGLSCGFEINNASEVGVGKLTTGSSISGKMVEILSEKQLSTECQVSK